MGSALSPAPVRVIPSSPWISVNRPRDVEYSILDCVGLVGHAGWSHGRQLLGVLVVAMLIVEMLLIPILILATLLVDMLVVGNRLVMLSLSVLPYLVKDGRGSLHSPLP